MLILLKLATLCFVSLFLLAHSEKSCTPNRFYCGSQVPQVPSSVQNMTLWQCGPDGKSFMISFDCNSGCKIKKDDNSYCLCTGNSVYCGHELNDIGWEGYEKHSLYECNGDGLNASLIESCQHKCQVHKVQGGKIGRCSSQCQDGYNYCGHRLKELGWDGYENDTLYQCRGGNDTTVWSKCSPGMCHSHHCKCNPDQYYCGHELFEQLGWINYKPSQHQHKLLKCAPEGSLVLNPYECQQCISGHPHPTCECKTGSTYCGNTLQAMGWDGYDNDTLYLCEKEQNDSHISKLMACGDGKCRGHQCECTRDKLYCGQELYQMGWRHLASANDQSWLGRCTDGLNVEWIVHCNQCNNTQPALTGDPRPTCECKSGGTYCGDTLHAMGLNGYDNSTLYVCEKGQNISKLMACGEGKCRGNQCECTRDKLYCGHELYKMGWRQLTSPIDHARLARCTNGTHISWVLGCPATCYKTDNSSKCGCEFDLQYCGHELLKFGWDGYENNTLYECDGGYNAKYTKTCQRECIPGTTDSSCGGACVQGTECSNAKKCTPGRRYCASIIYTTAWKGFGETISLHKNFTNDTIFRCKDEENVEYVETCARNECKDARTGSAHCLCSPNRTYCGHELYERYNSEDTYLYPHNIYVCSRTRLSVIEQSTCGNCHRLAGIPTCRQECSIGQYYCGSDLLLLEGWQDSDALPNWLYRCDNSTTGQPIADCLSGCVSNSSESGQDAFCSPSSTAWYWFFGGVAVPLVVIGLGFLLIRIVLKHRQLKKFLEEQRIDVSQLTVIKILGEGEFGEVWQGTYKNSDGNLLDVALKLSKEKNDAASKLACANCFLQEVLALDIVSHRNIIKVFGICLNFKDQFGNTVPALVLEYMNGGSAISYMRSEHKRLNGRDLLHIFIDICQAGDHLCKLGIIHRDIGARNVLVQKDHHTGHMVMAKLTDFGLAKDIGKLTSMYKATNLDRNMFHFRYTAPEGFRGCYCSKSDVWSFGVFMWELYTVMEEEGTLADLRLEQGRSGPTPYSELDTVADVLAEACSERKLKKPLMAPEKMYKIMRQCWETQEELRPSFEELIKFFNTYCDGSEIQTIAPAVDISYKHNAPKNGHGEKQVENNVIPHGYVCGSS